jgi:hypothetical protein
MTRIPRDHSLHEYTVRLSIGGVVSFGNKQFLNCKIPTMSLSLANHECVRGFENNLGYEEP